MDSSTPPKPRTSSPTSPATTLPARPPRPGTYTPLVPARILDTRNAIGIATTTPVPGQSEIALQVTGAGGVPATGVGAVVLNVTVTQPTWEGYITAYPTGSTRPVVSNLNFAASQTIPNLVTVKVGTGGQVTLFNGQFNATKTAHLIADVAGYYLAGTPTQPGAFVALSPSRILDTRNATGVPGTTPRPGQSEVGLQVTGAGGIPVSGVGAVVLNVTVTQPTWEGYITAYPTGSARPVVSNLNFAANQTIPNLVTVKVGAGGQVTLFNGQFAPDKTLHMIADVAGYFLADPPGPVTDVAVDALTTSGATLVWTNPTDASFTGVMIRRAVGGTAPENTSDGVLAVQTTGPVNLWSDSGLSAGETYSYALFADHDAGAGFAAAATLTLTVPATASLTGTVTGGGDPVAGVTVQVIGPDGIQAASAITGDDGTYAVAGLADGGYVVCFNPAGVAGLGFLPECWNDVGPGGTPTTVTINSGGPTTGIDASLGIAGSVSGHVTNSVDAPIAGVIVSVNDPGGQPITFTATDDAGDWVIGGLVTGTYSVCFHPPAGYATQCYNGLPPNASPTPITVTATAATTGIDAVLQPAAAALGRSAPTLRQAFSGEPTFPSTDLDDVACEDVLFLAARGSGEPGPGGENQNPDDTRQGVGQAVHAAYVDFKTQLEQGDGRTVTEPISVVYPADHVWKIVQGQLDEYIEHLWAGVTETRRALTERADQCPNERIVLAGYSQGAMVMHRLVTNATTDGADTLLDQAVLDRIDATILIGDGDRIANGATTKGGSAPNHAAGIGQRDATVEREVLNTTVATKTISVCQKDDPVCDFRFPLECVGLQLGACLLVHYGYGGFVTHTSYGGFWLFGGDTVVETAAENAAVLVQSVPAVGGSEISITGVVGTEVNRQLNATHSTTYIDTVSWTPPNLPSGLSLSGNGQITGIPNTATHQHITLGLTATKSGISRTFPVQATLSITGSGGPPPVDLTLTGHTDWVRDVVWSPDGTRLATRSEDGTARIWDAATGATIHTLTGHIDWVADVEWSPDGTRLATVGAEGAARIWNATTGATIHTFTDHWPGMVAWSPTAPASPRTATTRYGSGTLPPARPRSLWPARSCRR